MTEKFMKKPEMRYQSKAMESSSLREAALFLKEAHSVLLAPHVNIDGDDAGSMLALAEGLESMGIRTVCLSHDLLPDSIAFIDRSKKIVFSVPDGEVFDCLVLMECTNIKRLPEGFVPEKISRRLINIDHHKGNSVNGDINWIDTGAAALGEMVFILLKELGVSISKDMADALFLAIMSDTGGFRYSNTSSLTHEITAELIDLGADSYLCSKKFFLSVPPRIVRACGHLMSNLEFECSGRLVISRVTRDLVNNYGLSKKDLGGITERLNIIQGCEAFVLLTEQDDSSYSASLRATGDFNVRSIASAFGGGGHDAAAGCSLKDGDDAERLLGMLRERLS